MLDVEKWFSKKSPSHILPFMLVASILTIIVMVAVIYLAFKVCRLKMQYGCINGGDLAKIMGSMLNLPTAPVAEAKLDSTSSDSIMVTIPTIVLLKMIVKLLALLLAVWILYKILKYLYNRI